MTRRETSDGRALCVGLLLGLVALGGCATAPRHGARISARVDVLDTKIDAAHPANWQGLSLRTGQVILSEGRNRAWNLLFSLLPEQYYPFTHAGLIIIEDGEPFVYDFSGRYSPGFDERPTDAIVGGMKRRPLASYVRRHLYVEIFDPPAGVDPEALTTYVHELMAQEPEFDAYFNFDEHDRLFCSEFVELSLTAAGAEPSVLVPIRQNPSISTVLEWVAVPATPTLPAGALADPRRYRAALGRLDSQTAARVYFAAKRELHSRFTDDQAFGSVFQMSPAANIHLRADVREFFARAERLFDDDASVPDVETIDARVGSLANELFGPHGS